jgi:hypothetical protein
VTNNTQTEDRRDDSGDMQNGQEEAGDMQNGQEEAGDRQEWARGGRRQTGMDKMRQETDRNGQDEAGDRRMSRLQAGISKNMKEVEGGSS